MTTKPPPLYYFSGINFNSGYYTTTDEGVSLTQSEADSRYLIKTQADTASGIETFSNGIKSNTIDTINTTDITNISTNSSGNIFIGTSASRTSSNPIQIGTTASLIRFGTSSNSQISSNNLTMSNVQCLNLNSITPSATFGLLGSHTGAINIGNIVSRTGDISIASNQTIGTGNIVLGSSSITGAGTQNITINRPLTLAYQPSITNSFFQLGYSEEQTGTPQSLSTSGGTVFTSLLTGPLTSIYGIYVINYTITINITTATTFTSQFFGISKTSTGTTSANDFVVGCHQIKNIQEIYTSTSVLSYSGYIKIQTGEQLYLLMKASYGGSFTITGSAKMVRVG